MGFGRGFSAPSGVGRITTKISTITTENNSTSGHTFTSADFKNGAYYRIIPFRETVSDSLVISDVNAFMSSCGVSVGENISLKILVQNQGGEYSITTSFPLGVGLFGDRLPALQTTSTILDLNLFYVQSNFLAITVKNQEIRV